MTSLVLNDWAQIYRQLQTEFNVNESELQIKGCIKDNSKIILSYFSTKTYVVNPHNYHLTKRSRQDGYNERSQRMFLRRNMENFL